VTPEDSKSKQNDKRVVAEQLNRFPGAPNAKNSIAVDNNKILVF